MTARRILRASRAGLIATFLLCAAHTLTVATAQAQVATDRLNYQGRLTELDGTPADGTYSIVFSLYDLEVGGAPVWTETQSVIVDAGLFSVQLGSITPITADFSIQYWLEIEVDGDVMADRVALIPVPYAHFAVEADSAAAAAVAGSADHALESDHAISADSASEADHATAADNATSADYATAADHATTADGATHASEADHAATADTASNADQATSADYATEAGHATDADTLQGVGMSALEESADIESAIDDHEATMHGGQDSLLKGSDLTEETTQGTTWTEIASAAVAPGAVSDWVKVEVLLFTENLGSSTAMYSRYDISVGEPGLEVSQQDGDHFYLAGADNTVGAMLSTVILYYEPTDAEKTKSSRRNSEIQSPPAIVTSRG